MTRDSCSRRAAWWVAVGLLLAPAVHAQDAARGARLFNATGDEVNRVVAPCAGCHTNVSALRSMMANRAPRADDLRTLVPWLTTVLRGAHPGASGAMAQYRGVFSERDIGDLAAYIMSAQVVQQSPAWAQATAQRHAP